MKLKKFLLSSSFLSKLPIILLVTIFLVPITLLKINYQLGIFFIAFYIAYWTVKVFESYYYVLTSYITLLKTNKRDYLKTDVIQKEAKNLKHIIIIPFYNEPYDVIEDNVNAIIRNDYPHKENIIILLAPEERGKNAVHIAEKILGNFTGKGVEIFSIPHPADIK